jgi:hypothetical protein
MSESVNFLAGQKWLRTERHGGRNFPTLTSFGSAQPSMSEFEVRKLGNIYVRKVKVSVGGFVKKVGNLYVGKVRSIFYCMFLLAR